MAGIITFGFIILAALLLSQNWEEVERVREKNRRERTGLSELKSEMQKFPDTKLHQFAVILFDDDFFDNRYDIVKQKWTNFIQLMAFQRGWTRVYAYDKSEFGTYTKGAWSDRNVVTIKRLNDLMKAIYAEKIDHLQKAYNSRKKDKFVDEGPTYVIKKFNYEYNTDIVEDVEDIIDIAEDEDTIGIAEDEDIIFGPVRD